MKKILLFLGVLVLVLGLAVGVGSATLHTVITDSSIIYQDETGTAILTITDETVVYGTTVYDATILMEDTDQVQFDDSGMNIGATADGALAINSDGTLTTTVTTSYTLVTPIVTITATTRLDHQYDGSNYVRQTVSSAGSVKVLIVGSSDAYEIETGDGAIVLDADTGITLDSGDSTIGIIGDILGSNAAGPGIIDEAATSTNPTLCPNKADETLGIGWVSANIMSLIIGGGAEYGVSASGIDMNSNNLTEMGTYAGTGKVTITPGAAGTFLDFDLNASWLGGTLVNIDFSAATTPTQSIVGINLDLGTNVVATAEEDLKGLDITFPTLTVSADDIDAIGVEITGGTYTLSGSGTGYWTGVDITIPTMVETAGTLTAVGVKIAGGTLTTDPISYGIVLSGTFVTGIQIGLSGTPIDLVLATDRALEIYTSTDATGSNVMSVYIYNTIDGATATGRGMEVVLDVENVALGGWANAIKGKLDLSSTGSISGVGSAICAEIVVPAGAHPASGQYGVIELELVGASGYSGVNWFALIYAGAAGNATAITVLEDYSYLINLQGFNDVTGNMWFDNTVRCRIASTDWYLPFSSAQASYTTAYLIDVTVAAGTAIDIGTSVVGIDFTGTYSTAAIRLGTVGKITFYDADVNIYAADDGDLVINADATLIVTCPDITLAGAVLMSGFVDIGVFGTGIAVTAGTHAFEVHTEPGSAHTAYTSTFGVRSRYEISVAQTNTVTIHAVDARLRVKHNLAGGVHSGVTGYIEASGSPAFAGGINAAGVFTLELQSGTTITGGTYMCGVYIDSASSSDITVGGTTYVALMISAGDGPPVKEDWEVGILMDDGDVGIGMQIGDCTTGINLDGDMAIGISLPGAYSTAAISMDSGTFAAGDNEIEMRNTVTGDKTVIASGAASDDAAIVTAVGADADIADGSLYMEINDGAGSLWIKKNDIWVEFTNP